MSYGLLAKEGYTQLAVKHGAKEWALDDTRTSEIAHRNGVENFWEHLETSVRSTHIQISAKRMPTHLAGFTFRSNHRQMGNEMLDGLPRAVR